MKNPKSRLRISPDARGELAVRAPKLCHRISKSLATSPAVTPCLPPIYPHSRLQLRCHRHPIASPELRGLSNRRQRSANPSRPAHAEASPLSITRSPPPSRGPPQETTHNVHGLLRKMRWEAFDERMAYKHSPAHFRARHRDMHSRRSSKCAHVTGVGYASPAYLILFSFGEMPIQDSERKQLC